MTNAYGASSLAIWRVPLTDEENDLIVADYFAMLADDIAGRRYRKADHRRALLPLLNDRSEGSAEFKGRRHV